MVIIVPYYTHKPGGMCKRLYRLMNALAKRGHEVYYFTLDLPPIKLDNIRIQIIPFNSKERSGLLFWLQFTVWLPVYLLIKALQLKPKCIIIFNSYYAVLAKPAALVSRAKVLLFLRSMIAKTAVILDQPDVYKIAGKFFEKVGIFCANKIACTTLTMRKELGLEKDKRVIILENDLPNVQLETIEENIRPFKIFASGTFNKGKNFSLLLYAMSILNSQIKDVELLIAGDGVDRTMLEDQKDELNLTNVKFLGWQENPLRIAAKAQLIVHPSLVEGMSNSILEALALKKPIIASYIPEIRELLHYDDLLFDPYNAAALAAKIIKLIRSPEALQKARTLCAERANVYNFDWDSKASEFIENAAT